MNHTFWGDALLIGGVIISSLLFYLFKYNDASASAGWCFERMGLVWGILLYRFYVPIVAWMDKHRLLKIILLCLLAGILGIMYLKYKMVWFWGEYLLKIVLGFAIIIFFFTATSQLKVGNALGKWLGDISYEVYLLHGMVRGFLASYLFYLQSGSFILVTVVVTLILSWGVRKVDKPIVKKLRM